MSDELNRTEMAAQIAAGEARASTRLAEALGEMRSGFADIRGEMRTTSAELRGDLGKISARLDAVERTVAGTKTTVIATGIAVVAVIIAVLTYGQAWFGTGVSTRDMIRATVAEMQQAPR